MSGFTPGPWVVDPLNLGTLGDISTADGERAIAQAQPRQPLAAGRPDTERAANARLIAAAPDLLAALEAISPWIEHIERTPITAAENIRDAFSLYARAAIAKAKP